MAKLRLAFMGTPDFAIAPLAALIDAGHEIVVVYSQPPKPYGRGHQVRSSPLHSEAEKRGLPVRTPMSLRDVEEQIFLSALELDAIVVVAYGLILPQAVLDIPRLGCINIHFSLLPRWRGAAPVPRALLAGDVETGVSLMQMAAGLDTGDVLALEKVVIPSDATTVTLLAHLAKLGAGMTVKTLEGLDAGLVDPVAQGEEGVTYAAKLSREDGRIIWSRPALEIERQIRALAPWPGTFFMVGSEPIKLLSASLSPQSGAPGTLLDDQFTVACGDGALRLLTLQRPNKAPTQGAALLRGLRLPVGHSL